MKKNEKTCYIALLMVLFLSGTALSETPPQHWTLDLSARSHSFGIYENLSFVVDRGHTLVLLDHSAFGIDSGRPAIDLRIEWSDDMKPKKTGGILVATAEASLSPSMSESSVTKAIAAADSDDKAGRRVPKPESVGMLLLGAGLLGIASIGRRRIIKR